MADIRKPPTTPAWVILASAAMISTSIIAAGVGGVYVYKTAGVPSAPQAQGLKTLVPQENRAVVSEFYRALSVVVKETSVSTNGQLRDCIRLATSAAKKLYSFPELPEFSKEISERMESVLGLDDGSIDRQKASEFFLGVAEELK